MCYMEREKLGTWVNTFSCSLVIDEILEQLSTWNTVKSRCSP